MPTRCERSLPRAKLGGMAKRQLRLVPLGDPESFRDAVRLLPPETALRDLLVMAPALSLEPLFEKDLDQPLATYLPLPVQAGPQTQLYRPPGLMLSAPAHQEKPAIEATPSALFPVPAREKSSRSVHPHPAPTKADQPLPDGRLRDVEAVRLAYGEPISSIASFLRGGLSVLVTCDKLVVEHLWQRMAVEAGLEPVLLAARDAEGGLLPGGPRPGQLAQLRTLLRDLKDGDVLVLPHLDLLVGEKLSIDARELIEILYSATDRLILAFADRSLPLPEVLAGRFAVRRELAGVPRDVRLPTGEQVLLGDALVGEDERASFEDFDAGALYKNVAGMNPVRLRQAITYAVRETAAAGPVPVDRLYEAIRSFKVQTSASFEIPDVGWDDIGGYEDVKAELDQALGLMLHSYDLPDPRLQKELIPRGFIFHGPPGTGKTLFAKAVANRLHGTIQVVSGPEITDKYVGESERRIREIFAEARRNAPAVLVLDEFDAIAAQRSGRDDGGSRAGNAIVAQILTEMDGFRPDVPMLVIGTSNRIDIIDEALLRPSRFRAIGIGLPGQTARRAIAAVHAAHFHVPADDALLNRVAEITEGFNGDEIRSLFRDACVGRYCEDPPRDPDLARLEELAEGVRALREI